MKDITKDRIIPEVLDSNFNREGRNIDFFTLGHKFDQRNEQPIER